MVMLGRFDDDMDYDRHQTVRISAFHNPVAPIDVDMSGEEAYQRRLAISASTGPVSPLPPRVATETAPTLTSPAALESAVRPVSMTPVDDDEIPGFGASPPPVPAVQDETGEEVYLRRLAMSQQAPADAPVRPPTPEPPALAYNPFAPPASVPPPPSDISDMKVKNSRQIAAAIAARLSALAPPPTSSEPATTTGLPSSSSSEAEVTKKYVTLANTPPIT